MGTPDQRRSLRGGEHSQMTPAVARMLRAKCTVMQCDGQPAARGLCWKHYKRQRRHGSALTIKRRYRLPHECRFCGTTSPESFYESYKSICKTCRKLRTLYSVRTPLL